MARWKNFKAFPPGPLRCEMVRALVSLFLDVAQLHGYELAVGGSIIRTFSLKRNTRTNSLKPPGSGLKSAATPRGRRFGRPVLCHASAVRMGQLGLVGSEKEKRLGRPPSICCSAAPPRTTATMMTPREPISFSDKQLARRQIKLPCD